MITAIFGFLLGIAALVLGNTLEGGHVQQLVQPTAALIVFGGTMGATMLGTSVRHFSGAIRSIPKVILSREPDFRATVEELVVIANRARKEGILSLESTIATITDPFLAKNLQHVIDGYDPNVLKTMMDETISKEEEEKVLVAKVWESAGGYSPTIGILGAVLGLIHVMSNLSDSAKLGAGIAVAFVATVYGVGGANLILIPVANRLRYLAQLEIKKLEVIATGLSAIQAGLNPRVIDSRLRSMIGEDVLQVNEVAPIEERKAA